MSRKSRHLPVQSRKDSVVQRTRKIVARVLIVWDHFEVMLVTAVGYGHRTMMAAQRNMLVCCLCSVQQNN